jgi:DNA-binding transcriptional LysR family regulator
MNDDLGWDDLRLVLAIARGGGLSGAARTLQLSHATVFRRLNSAEEQLGVRLFERFRTGYEVTPAGRMVVDIAEQVEAQVREVERRVTGQDLRPTGTVRVTVVEALLPVISPCLAEVHRNCPGIVLDLVISNDMLNLGRRDADIALRATNTPPPDLFGRKVGRIACGVYGARHVAEAGHDLTVQGWVGPDHSVAHVSPAKWMKSNIPEAPVAGRSNSLMGEMALTRAGIGIAVLPCYLGDADEDLQRLDGPEPLITVDVWLLMHDDLRRTARVRAVMDILASSLAKLRPLLDREAPAVE